MTYFLNGGDAPVVKAQNPDAGLTGLLGGLGAAWDKAQIENNSNFRLYRERRSGYADRADQALAILDGGDVQKELERRGLYTDGMLPKEAVRANPKAAQAVIEMGRAAAEQSPDLWSGIDLSDDGVNAEVNARLQAEYEEAEQILDMMPGGRGAAEIVGAIGGITADIRNAPFLLLGGGSGSLLRVMGREAAINMAAEAAFLSDQFEMAERLNIPDPDVKTQLLMAAAGGAVFGGLVEGGARALTYWRGRNTVTPVRGYDSASTDTMVTAAEEALVANQNPLRAVQEAVEASPREKPYESDSAAARTMARSNDFREWASGSEVVDSNGNPTVVYHGTFETFDDFDLSMSGSETGAADASGAIFFSDNPAVASSYATLDPYKEEPFIAAINRATRGLYAKANEAFLGAFGRSSVPTGGNVRPSYLSIRNPYKFDYGGLEYDESTFKQIVDAARKGGHDGIIIRNVDDAADGSEMGSVYVVFDPNQVRSVFSNPINPDKPPLITTERLPPIEGQTPQPLPDQTITAQAEAALKEVEKSRSAPFESKPFTQRLRSRAKIHPDGPLAQELKSQDVTSRTIPGLFSRKGANDLDNLVASEWDDAIPGISSVTGTEGIYLSRQGVIDAIIAEAHGHRLRTFREMELQAREADALAADRSPEEDFLAGADSGIEGRLFIDQNQLGFLTDQDVATMVDDWLAARNWTDLITPQERAELVAAMRANGGDAEYLVERMWERDLDYAALPPQEAPDYDIPFGENELAPEEAVGPGVGTGGGPDANPVSARGGGEGLADDAGQTFIPGTDRIDTGLSQRQRAEMAARQQQSKIRRLDQTRIEDTEGTLFGGAQSDLFSDPASPQARPILDDMTASLRDDIQANGDSMIDMGDGKGERSVSSVLDDLDRGDEFADILDLCGKPMVKGGS